MSKEEELKILRKLSDMRDYETVIQLIEKSSYKNNGEVQCLYGNALRCRHQDDDATKALQNSLLTVNTWEPHFYLGDLIQKKTNQLIEDLDTFYNKSLAHYQKAIARNPPEEMLGDINSRIGYLYFKLGDYDKAIEILYALINEYSHWNESYRFRLDELVDFMFLALIFDGRLEDASDFINMIISWGDHLGHNRFLAMFEIAEMLLDGRNLLEIEKEIKDNFEEGIEEGADEIIDQLKIKHRDNMASI